jgi:glycerol-3-phosphate acyltransferase PlsY
MPLLVVSIGYLAGSIPFAFLAGRYFRGVDIRRIGSGNVGAANVLRSTGALTAVVVMLLDAAKGAGAVFFAQRLAPGDAAPAAAGIAAVVGHVYPIWLRFRGGKGVATAAGAFAVLTPLALAPAAAIFVATVWATRFISLGSIVATLALGPIALALGASGAVVGAAGAVALLIVFRHRTNIGRLLAGTERRIGQKAAL